MLGVENLGPLCQLSYPFWLSAFSTIHTNVKIWEWLKNVESLKCAKCMKFMKKLNSHEKVLITLNVSKKVSTTKCVCDRRTGTHTTSSQKTFMKFTIGLLRYPSFCHRNISCRNHWSWRVFVCKHLTMTVYIKFSMNVSSCNSEDKHCNPEIIAWNCLCEETWEDLLLKPEHFLSLSMTIQFMSRLEPGSLQLYFRLYTSCSHVVFQADDL